MTGRPSRLAARLKRFVHDRTGVSAVEFALVLPIMVALYVGGVELTEGFNAKRRVSHIASSLADLTAQNRSVNDTSITDIFKAATAILAPYGTTGLQMSVSGVTIDANRRATVTWSKAPAGNTPLKAGDPVVIPASVRDANTFIVMAAVEYTYQPPIGYVLTGPLKLSDNFYLRPRLSAKVCWNATSC